MAKVYLKKQKNNCYNNIKDVIIEIRNYFYIFKE